MPVAQQQIQELLEVLDDVLSEGQKIQVLKLYRKTEAYRKNSSFRVTIDRLLSRIQPLPPKRKVRVLGKGKLISLLKYMATVIEEDDSFGGFLEYEASLENPHKFRVKARFRTGNSMGQGSLVII